MAPNDRGAVRHAIESALHDGRDSELEIGVRPPRGSQDRRCAVTVAAVDGEDGRPGALICVSDVTESAQLREQLKLQATHDALTGCLNRSALMQALEDLLAENASPAPVVVFVDIDNFKPVNDRLGHAAGDDLLIHVARRLERLCREEDLVGRLGGDEFLLVCRGSDEPQDARAVAARVRDAFDHPIALPTGHVELRASVGVAQPGPATTAEELISAADAAMYACKRRRDNEPVLFTDIAGQNRDGRGEAAAAHH